MIGYKVFNSDWTCRDFQYEVGMTYSMNKKPVCCEVGYHFCKDLKDCFNYYDFDSNNKVAMVEAIGDIDEHDEDSKCCTNEIRIVRELSWSEVLKKMNTGKNCTGDCNSGDCNSGDWNSGNWNSGYRNSGNCNSGNWNSGNRNSGYRNSGDWNSGDRNSGDCNSGNWNSGNCNSGDWNSGDRNSGDWNNTSFSSGCFNTEEAKILMFNKPSDWTFRDWLDSRAKRLLDRIPKAYLQWVYTDEMTDVEKEQHPECATTGGFLKVYTPGQSVQMWYDGLDKSDQTAIKELPNFDADIFEKITGIRIGG